MQCQHPSACPNVRAANEVGKRVDMLPAVCRVKQVIPLQIRQPALRQWKKQIPCRRDDIPTFRVQRKRRTVLPGRTVSAMTVPCRAHEHGTGLDACNRSLCRLDLRSDPGDDLQDPSRRVYMGEKMTLDHVLLVWFTKRSGRLSRILQMIPR